MRTGRVGVLIAALAMAVHFGALPGCAELPPDTREGPGAGGVILPVNQVLTPAGKQVELPGLRPQVLALSPDSRILVTSGKTSELVVVDPQSGDILQRAPLPSDISDAGESPISPSILRPDKGAQVSYTGLVFSPDGSRIYLSSVNGSVKVFSVSADRRVAGLGSFSLPAAGVPARKAEIPAGLALSPDGTRLYVALTVSNRLAELDSATGKPLRLFDVGTAPYDVVVVGRKAFVSNWGGRRPDAKTTTGPGGLGTKVRVDPVRFIANEGSVTMIDLETGKAIAETVIGSHSCGMVASPNGRRLYVACAGTDTVTVLDTQTASVVATIPIRTTATDPPGASPNALALDPTGNILYVCCGGHNAVAVVRNGQGEAHTEGWIPTGWYPGAVIFDAVHGKIDVANIKGIGSWTKTPGAQGYNSWQCFGTLCLVPTPTAQEIGEYTRQVMENNRGQTVKARLLPARAGVPARPVPERVGEPSVFKHVVYIIKENRSYDQVLGDMKEGNGAPPLCIFGEKVTPNEHRLAREFSLLDNTYCCGVCSADGHQWTDSAFATDYLERSFCGFPRSYTNGHSDNDVDALAYSPAGFLWDNALAHGKTLRDYGEFTISTAGWKEDGHRGSPGFLDFYSDFRDHAGLTRIGCRPAIESLARYIKPDGIGWDLRVPDVLRAAQFNAELSDFEKAGTMPDLTLLYLPNDHTSGTGRGAPTPRAQVADNDLALGQVVEGISHSRFWKDTCIFIIEDDPQSGFDHVSSYRTTAFVISAYTRRHAVIHKNFNQTSLIRTMELILGLPPMNLYDASATPMSDCFTAQLDLGPYTAVPNSIPLDEMNPSPQAVKSAIQRQDALVSARLPLNEPDLCPDDVLNRILWHAQKGYRAPYPEWAVSVKTEEEKGRPRKKAGMAEADD